LTVQPPPHPPDGGGGVGVPLQTFSRGPIMQKVRLPLWKAKTAEDNRAVSSSIEFQCGNVPIVFHLSLTVLLRYRSPTPYLGCGERYPVQSPVGCGRRLRQPPPELLGQCCLATVILFWLTPPAGSPEGDPGRSAPTGLSPATALHLPGQPPPKGGQGSESPLDSGKHPPKGGSRRRSSGTRRSPEQYSKSLGYPASSGLWLAARTGRSSCGGPA